MACRNRLIHTHTARTYRASVTQDAAKQLANDTNLLQAVSTLTKNDKFSATIYVVSKWYNNDNTIKKKDIQNLDKQVIDSVFDAIRLVNPGIDDSQIFNLKMHKIHHPTQEQTTLSLEVI